MSNPERFSESELRTGVLIGLAAYTLWGVFPVYFKFVETVQPLEILAHRVIWAVPFGAMIILLRRQWEEVKCAFTHRKMLFWLSVSALCIAINWLVYIWAVVNDRIFEASLGYYINPLIYVMVGVLFLGERLRGLQIAAVALAAIGVAVLTISGGTFPWAAMLLAIFFTAYGVIRKRVVIGAMPGLFVETALLFPFAIAYLAWLIGSQQASFASGEASLSGLLMLGGPVSVIPLLFFAIAARRLTLTTVGFMQFLAPTLQFLVGVYYGENLTTAHIICFGLIWTAVAFFSYDAIRTGRKKVLQEKLASA